MKTIGMIGGMSWQSSIEYYRLINEILNDRLGGLHSAKIVMVSVDFAEIEILQQTGKWTQATEYLISVALQVEKAGADFFIICTNTMHLMADDVEANTRIPLLHIADATAEAIRSQNLKSIGLLGTAFTMEKDFYKGRLSNKYGLQVIIPNQAERDIIHRVIYDELVLGIIKPSSRKDYLRIINNLMKRGAQGIVLGCTEIGLLVKKENCRMPIFDTTLIHASAAVNYSLSDI